MLAVEEKDRGWGGGEERLNSQKHVCQVQMSTRGTGIGSSGSPVGPGVVLWWLAMRQQGSQR